MAFEQVPFERRVNALVALLVWVEEQVSGMIAELVARDPENPAAGTLRWVRKRQRLLDAMLAEAATRVHRELPEIFDEAWVSGLHISGLRPEFGAGLNREAIDLLAQGLRKDIDAALYQLGRRTNDLFRELTMKHVALHIVAGTGAKAAAKTLERELIKRGTRAFVDRAGRQWSLANYTDMAIRTVTREAMTQGTVAGMQANGKTLVSVSHHVNSCHICLPYDGNTFALPGHSVPGYRTLRPDELAPFHPRCKHVMGPAAVEFDTLEAELLGATA